MADGWPDLAIQEHRIGTREFLQSTLPLNRVILHHERR
jgi:hypothetical protein